MSHLRTGALEDLQNLLPWPLWADTAFFNDVPVIDYRKADIASEINMSLGVVTETGGKCGACVIVLPLAARVQFREASGAFPLRCILTFRILENPTINLDATHGTQKTVRMIAQRIRQVLQNYLIEGFSSPFVPDEENFIVPIDDPAAPEAYDVMFQCIETVQQHYFQCAMPRLFYNDTNGQLELTCETPDVTIYYTLDGTFPFTSAAHPNPSAQIYTGPITMEGEWFIMCAAVKEDHLISSVRSLRSNQISSQAGDGESLGAIS